MCSLRPPPARPFLIAETQSGFAPDAPGGRGAEGPGAPRPQQGPACSLCGKYLFWFEWTPFHKDHLVVINNTYFQIICRSLGRAHGTHPNRDLFKGNCKWAGFTAGLSGGRLGAPGEGRGARGPGWSGQSRGGCRVAGSSQAWLSTLGRGMGLPGVGGDGFLGPFSNQIANFSLVVKCY